METLFGIIRKIFGRLGRIEPAERKYLIIQVGIGALCLFFGIAWGGIWAFFGICIFLFLAGQAIAVIAQSKPGDMVVIEGDIIKAEASVASRISSFMTDTKKTSILLADGSVINIRLPSGKGNKPGVHVTVHGVWKGDDFVIYTVSYANRPMGKASIWPGGQ